MNVSTRPKIVVDSANAKRRISVQQALEGLQFLQDPLAVIEPLDGQPEVASALVRERRVGQQHGPLREPVGLVELRGRLGEASVVEVRRAGVEVRLCALVVGWPGLGQGAGGPSEREE